MRVALGLKARTGRAALVAVAGDVREPQFVERSQIQLLPEGAWAPYHAAEGLAPAAARESVKRSIASAHRLAASGIRQAARRTPPSCAYATRSKTMRRRDAASGIRQAARRCAESGHELVPLSLAY